MGRNTGLYLLELTTCEERGRPQWSRREALSARKFAGEAHLVLGGPEKKILNFWGAVVEIKVFLSAGRGTCNARSIESDGARVLAVLLWTR